MQIIFKVEGNPQGKGRPRFARMGGFVKTYTDVKTKSYEQHIAFCAKNAMGASEPLKTPVDAFIYISIPIPMSYSKKRKEACLNGLEKPTKKPDIDNVCKGILDSLNGIVYKDDTQIVSLHCTKVYGEPFVEVLIKESE
jgi:Holliday junction resolvase RusA-like endonuclease